VPTVHSFKTTFTTRRDSDNMQFKLILTALAALVPLVASTSVTSAKDCKSGEFWCACQNVSASS